MLSSVDPADPPELPPPFAARLVELEAAERRARLGAAHARHHLDLLAEGSRALVAGFDDVGGALRALVAVVVGAFADWCAVDVMDRGRISRVASTHADPGAGARLPALLAEWPEWAAPVHRVMASGTSELVWDVHAPPGLPEDADHLALIRALGLESYLIVPIRIQGLSVGAITCATAPGRRGYRASDVAAVEELAARTALTLERISLYQETERAAGDAAARAGLLRRLTEAARAVQPQRSLREVANVVAEQARRVLGTRHALVVLDRTPAPPLRVGAGPGGLWTEVHERLLADLDSGSVDPGSGDSGSGDSGSGDSGTVGSRSGAPVAGPGTGPAPVALSARLYNRSGTPVGTLAVGTKETGELTGDDEAILVSLAQMASVAIENAHLYETVRSGEERLLALVEAAPLAILDLGLDGEVRRSNTAAEQLLGDPGGPGTDPDTGFGFHPDTAILLRRLVADTAAGGPVTDLETVAWRADGAEVPVSLAGAPLRDSQGTIDGVLVLATDVTARRRLEEQLVRARRIEAVGQMAGGVAHDFNNLLTVILGHATLLAGALPDDDFLRADVEAISAAAERAAGITSQLLTISRGDLVSSEVFDARARLRHLVGILRSILPASVELVVSLEAGEHLVRMSPAQFDQVILNLAVNARDAMGGAGTVTVRLVGASESMTIEVIDTGAGMDPATAERCFEPFFTTKGGLRGTGLGLATVHSVVTGTGGDLTLTTAVAQGTTFRVRLPRAEGEVAAPVSGQRHRERRPGSERILLVEDEDGLRRLCAEVLRSAGYVVTPATDGQAALDLIDTGDDRPDLVVTDVVMPRIGGVELARRLTEIRPTLPVLFMTGYVDATSRPDLEGAEVLTKPFLVDELVDKVRQVLDRTGGEPENAAGQGSKR